MIRFDEEKRLFHLRNDKMSCVLVLRTDEEDCEELLMPYLGAPLDDPSASFSMAEWSKSASFDSVRDRLPYACPTDGRGDFRPVLLRAANAAGQGLTEMFYVRHTIEKGKPALPGLPATYTEDPEEAETLTVLLRDPLTGLEAEMCYTLFASLPVLAAHMRLHNSGGEPLTLENAGSFALSLRGRMEMLHLHGAWARERAVERVSAAALTREISSCRGASGHEHNPFAALLAPGTDEFHGVCYGVSLVYSGDFRIAVDENPYGETRLVAGLNPRSFRWRLAPGESFVTPEAVCVCSGEGLNGMSQVFHTLYRTRLCRGAWRDRDRPVLINNWEATYFDFTHDRLMTIARTAAEAGVELFVLDDGWFGRRDRDNCSLGDWVEDRRKLPRGLKGLAQDMSALGLRLGVWVEPEMVSPDSDLYRAHPDWCLHVPGRRRTQARQQLILDMSREEVQAYVIDAVSRVLREASIAYVKWDMNRNFQEAGSPTLLDGREGELAHRYMLGLYRVLEKITSDFPEVLFESCSGGGGRFDAGMLHYMPQTWTSDDTDAMERLAIQYGTSLCYPPCAMGAHVSAVPNHQVKRVTSMKTRGEVAMGGNFGYELDLSAQMPEDLAEIRRQVALVKQLRTTTRAGTFTRLLSPFEGETTAWQFADDARVILCVYRRLAQANAALQRVFPRGLDPAARYRLSGGETRTGADWMAAGVLPELPAGDFASCVMVLEKG